MKSQTCCFTGHRNIPACERAAIQKRLEERLVKLINKGVIYFGNGGALGFDTLAALTVLKLKKIFPQIKLIMVLPCKDQNKKWCEQDKKIYNQILSQADKVVYVSEFFYNGCLQKRNRHLVNNSEVCVCFLTCLKGGTAYTVNYAKQKGLYIINLAEKKYLQAYPEI